MMTSKRRSVVAIYGDIFQAVGDHIRETLVGEDRFGEFRKVLLGEFDDRRVDLHLGKAPHGFVLEYLFGDPAIAAADDQHVARVAVPNSGTCAIISW